jgi:hypothetical protein
MDEQKSKSKRTAAAIHVILAKAGIHAERVHRCCRLSVDPRMREDDGYFAAADFCSFGLLPRCFATLLCRFGLLSL